MSTYHKARYEEDRLNLLHRIVFHAEVEEWELTEKYKQLYRDIYGALPGELNGEG